MEFTNTVPPTYLAKLNPHAREQLIANGAQHDVR